MLTVGQETFCGGQLGVGQLGVGQLKVGQLRVASGQAKLQTGSGQGC